MRKKNGFTLIELLIVLAVIAALIATMTPLALNAIRRSQASKVAQNIKILANMLEVAAYVNGTADVGGPIRGPEGDNIKLRHLGRDIPSTYALVYENEDGYINAIIATRDRVNLEELQKLIPAARTGAWGLEVQSKIARDRNEEEYFRDIPDEFKESNGADQVIYYEFSFKVY